MDLQGRVAWITGGARMGLAVARLLAQAGCRILVTYRRSKVEAEAVASEIRSAGSEALVLRCDLARKSDIQATLKRAQRTFGQLDILVNLSSMYERGGWALHWQQNANSAFELTTAAAASMGKSGGGRIIHIADWTSASGRPRYKGFTGYYASKAAIQSMVEGMALDLAPKILVNAIAPGPMIPPKGITKKEYQAVIAATPLKKWGGAEEIAKAVKFLCESDFVTGETIRVDGGRHLY